MKFTLRQIRRVILLVAFLIIAGGIGYFLGIHEVKLQKQNLLPKITINRKVPAGKQASVDFNLFWQVWDELQAKYLVKSNLDPVKMVNGAISGMVSALGDPYTVFLPPVENKETKDDLRGDFEGVGIQIDYNKDKKLAVVAPLSGTPAEKAGLKAGDLILRIVDTKQNIDRDTNGISLPEAVALIRGPKGSSVQLTILHSGSKDSFVVTLKRETIVVKSAEVKFVDQNNKKVAVITLSRFGDRTYQEWQEAVDQIKTEEAKNKNFGGVIFDLRNNPGGYLQGAVYVGSEFLSSGVIVQQDRGVQGKDSYSVNRTGRLIKEPLMVLVNGGSASASEIVAGALQETKRAKLVGEKTFGKGTVQEAEDLTGGAGLHVTVARWLLPSGASIDKTGVSPDIEVKMDPNDATKDPVMEKALELLTK